MQLKLQYCAVYSHPGNSSNAATTAAASASVLKWANENRTHDLSPTAASRRGLRKSPARHAMLELIVVVSMSRCVALRYVVLCCVVYRAGPCGGVGVGLVAEFQEKNERERRGGGGGGGGGTHRRSAQCAAISSGDMSS